MATLPTIAIVSWKNPEQRWLINASDFDPARHTRWEDRVAQHADPEPEERPTMARAVVIGGVPYPSMTAAAEATGIDRRTIGRRLESGEYLHAESEDG